ncbi:MAG: TIGR04282 family arsenosugar biosynthesis glycosyltransferase [Betaproteobacteria bacterium]|jgi:rSAM/selenodomain-associated transferase 1
MSGVRIVIFAKAPLPGVVKTRLIPTLGAEGAAQLARRMLEHTVAQAQAAAVGPVELCVTPSGDAAPWQSLSLSRNVAWSDQGEGDLGERMGRAVQRVTAMGESILLIGTDCPELGAVHLRHAAASLQRSDATMIPTADGGYVLIGLNQYHASLFENIAWSTNGVARETLRRFQQLNWTVQDNVRLHDIDEPADLEWLPAGWLDPAPQHGQARRPPCADHENH